MRNKLVSTHKNTRNDKLFFTGEKLKQLENLESVQSFCRAVESNKYSSFDLLEEEGLRRLVAALIDKNNEAHAPISNTAYSAVMIYRTKHGYSVHAGANIDPARPEWLKLPQYRNCAEKQAALSASKDGLKNNNMVAMLLYRKQEPEALLKEEKLLPCLDCTRNYLYDLVANQGKLIVVMPNNSPRRFFIETDMELDSNHIMPVALADRTLYYKIFKPTELNFLKIEKQLGARVNKA